MSKLSNYELEVVKKTLNRRNYSRRTIEIYCSYIKRFVEYFDKDIYHISTKEAVAYLESYEYKSVSQQEQMINSIKALYREVLGSKLRDFKIKRPRKNKKMPKAISRQQAKKLINHPKNLKHKAILYLLYTSGIRRSELLNLRIFDILSDVGKIKINQSKGNKDRMTVLTDSCLMALRNYVREYRPKKYLFEGQFGDRYSEASLLNVVKNNAKELGFHCTPHMLRHSFATHLIEDGVPMARVAQLLGHNSTKTTEIYTHLAEDYGSVIDLAA